MPEPRQADRSGALPPLSPPTAEDLARMRAARIANLAAHLEAERRARGLRSWSDAFRHPRTNAA